MSNRPSTSGQQQRYRVIEKLASGGMAEVFRAESAGIEGFKKKVAIKRVLPHLSRKQKFISMFLDEARLSAHLTHSNVVQVFDIGMGDDAYFIVMEYVDGADLKAISEMLRRTGRDFPVEHAAYIGTKICDGLSYAHELVDGDGKPFGIVHRDVSPPNAIISRYGEVKLADFGLAKAGNQLERSEPGVIKGKFSYLSPEAASGQDVDSRADIFSAGIILWEILAGRRLFAGDTDYQTVTLVQEAVIPSLAAINPVVPIELENIIRAALAQRAADRPSARELSRALTSFLFHYGRPVGPYDIAELVSQAMRVRQRDKPQGASIIDRMIEEALFEFTSLRGSDPGPGSNPGSGVSSSSDSSGSALLDRFSSGRDWASEIVIKGADQDTPSISVSNGPDTSAMSSIPLQMFEEGNLAALEDDDVTPPRGIQIPSDAIGEPVNSQPEQAAQPIVNAPSASPATADVTDDIQAVQKAAVRQKQLAIILVAAILAIIIAAVLIASWHASMTPHP